MNKVLMLTAVAAIFNLTVSAQIKKGSILLGGQFSYSGGKISNNNAGLQSDLKDKVAFYNVAVGTAIRENKILGVSITYGHLNSDYNNTSSGGSYFNSKGDQYGFDVFYRQYKKLAKDFYFLGELAAGYAGSNRTDSDLQGNKRTKQNMSGGNLYLSPGIAYRVYKKLQIELMLPQIAGVSYATEKIEDLPAGGYQKQDYFRFKTNLNSSFLSNLALGFKFVL